MLADDTIAGLTTEKLRQRLDRIDRSMLSESEVRRMQGSAGVQDLYAQIKAQVLGNAGA